MKSIQYSKINSLQSFDIQNHHSSNSSSFTRKLALLAVFLVLIFTIFNLQIIDSTRFLLRGSNLSYYKQRVKPLRGLFYDVNGELLVKNEKYYDVYLIHREYTENEINEISNLISQIESIDAESRSAILAMLVSEKFDQKILKGVSQVEVSKINSVLSTEYFYFDEVYKRNYIYPYEFAHIIGYTSEADAEDVKSGAFINDQIGKYKLEQVYQDKLRGVDGRTVYINGVESFERPEAGQNVHLTINLDWQRYLYSIIENETNYHGASSGAGVVVDDSTGNIAAIVGYPSFDSNEFAKGISESAYQEYITGRGSPLLDKAIALQAAPGSTFKVITAYSLLENGITDENTTYFSNRCINQTGFDFCEYQKFFYGQMGIVRALYKSSNLFFCTQTLNMYKDGRFNEMLEDARSFGIGELTGINLPGEAGGNLDSPEYKKEVFGLNWFDGDTCNMVIGQGSLLLTPIQLAMVASTIANKGTMYQPNVIQKISDVYGNTVEEFDPVVKRQLEFGDKTWDLITEGMYKTANYFDGTVHYFLQGLPGNIRVKTGTAEAYENVNGQLHYKTHGWIMGTFDYEGKSYSFAFHLNLGGGGFYIGKALKDFVTCVYYGC